MELITSVEDELVHRQVIACESACLVVGWAIDDIVAVNLLCSPILRFTIESEVEGR